MSLNTIRKWWRKLIEQCLTSGQDRLALIEIAGHYHLIPVDEDLDSTLAEGAILIGVYTSSCHWSWWRADPGTGLRSDPGDQA